MFELLKHKAQDCINFEDNQGQVPLHVAVQFAPLGRNALILSFVKQLKKINYDFHFLTLSKYNI